MSSPAHKRILREIKDIKKNPMEGIIADPLPNNLFEWHFTIKGVDKSEFEGIFVLYFIHLNYFEYIYTSNIFYIKIRWSVSWKNNTLE